MSGIEIVALGYVFNEHIAWPDGRLEGPFLGGTLSYGAVTLGRLGARAGLVTTIGKDTPVSLLKPFFRCGVNLAGLNVIDGAQETKDILYYKRDGTKTIEYLSRAPLIEFNYIPDEYLAAKSFLFCLVDYEVPIATLRQIRNTNARAMFAADLGGAGGAHSTSGTRQVYLAGDSALQKEYLSFFDIGKVSMEDAERAFDRAFGSAEQVADVYIDCGIGMVIVTLGENGVYIRSRAGDEYRVKAVPTDYGAVDTTGAGDTYIAAFTARYMETNDIREAAVFAGAAASLLIEKSGGVDISRIPTRAMVIERKRKNGR